MRRPCLLLVVQLAAACVLLPGVATAQYAPYPYGFAPGTMPYRAQPMYREDPDDLYYTPRARSRPQQVRPWRGDASFPSDADPDYSTAGGSDEDVDFTETTRATVADPTGQAAGTLTINTSRRKLYLSLGDGRALEYGIGVGRQGFAWKGEARIGRKAYWPGWTPPREMLARRPDLPSHMDGGLENPLGARALYLFQGNKDTLFRIHGTNEPDTIGKAVSSGCIRMLNADVIDLYQRVPKNARVIVI
jgi:lipoprotein-anchoring transpeptidase ErfK/SrfK